MSIESHLQEIERHISEIRAEGHISEIRAERGEERITLIGADGFRREYCVARGCEGLGVYELRLPVPLPMNVLINPTMTPTTPTFKVRRFLWRWGDVENGTRVFREVL